MIKYVADLIIGTEVSDLEKALEYLYLDLDDYPFVFKLAKCNCGCEEFLLQEECDAEKPAVIRVCFECGEKHYICDSEKRWGKLWEMNMVCGCGSHAWNIGVVFSLFEEGGEVRRITTLTRCCECHYMNYHLEWDIDYTPSRHLLEMV